MSQQDTSPPKLMVGVVVGSLRQESMCRKLASNAMRMAPPSLRLQILEIGDLPLYDEDLDEGLVPLPWQRFRDEVRSVDAVLFLTPEYMGEINSLSYYFDTKAFLLGENE